MASLFGTTKAFSADAAPIVNRQTALITGSTDGIGLTTAKQLAANGYNVLVHGRSKKRTKNACRAIQSFVDQKATSKNVIIQDFQADLSELNQCERLANEVKKFCQENDLNLSVLMNNAGVFAEERKTSPDGLELTMAVNVVAPFVLTSHLLPELLKQNDNQCQDDKAAARHASRIVTASSIAQSGSIYNWNDIFYWKKRNYSPYESYGDSKLLDAMLSQEFAERLQAANFGADVITSNSVHPGVVNTKMLNQGWGSGGISVDRALDEAWACMSPELNGVTGEFLVSRNARSKYHSKDRSKLWALLSSIAPKAAEMWKFQWYGVSDE